VPDLKNLRNVAPDSDSDSRNAVLDSDSRNTVSDSAMDLRNALLDSDMNSKKVVPDSDSSMPRSLNYSPKLTTGILFPWRYWLC